MYRFVMITLVASAALALAAAGASNWMDMNTTAPIAVCMGDVCAQSTLTKTDIEAMAARVCPRTPQAIICGRQD